MYIKRAVHKELEEVESRNNSHSYCCRQKSRMCSVVVRYTNVDFISETNEDTAMGKLQICQLQPTHSGLTTSNIYK